jgi:beta-lactamase superfamily II metal-dependent hydrolase
VTIKGTWLRRARGKENAMFKIEMLLAGHGDCLWIEYGDPKSPRRVLIDGGATGTHKRALRAKLLNLPEKKRRFELLMITHIDADHITGVLDLLEDKAVGFQANDIWFNGYRHLPDENPDTLGPVQGEKLTDLLVKPGMRWNCAFGENGKNAVVVPNEGKLPRITLEGGLVLTLLSPTPGKLAELKPNWEKEVRKAGLDPNVKRPEEAESEEGFELLAAPNVDTLAGEAFSEDSAEANGSSIAVLAEFDGRRILLTGDAHPSVLTAAIKRLGKSKLAVDLCKLPHHGSKANVSRAFLEALDCKRYLFSTNGAHFKHPDQQTVARVIKWGGAKSELMFNYRTKFNEGWGAKPLREKHGYTAVYPQSENEGLVVECK